MNDRHLKPLLVLGTGFHRYATAENPQFECLYSWQKLLREVANRMGLPLREYLTDRPTLQWEQLLLDAAKDGYNFKSKTKEQHFPQSVFHVEAHARKVVVDILGEKSLNYPRLLKRSQYPLDSVWGAVCSFNFDKAWIDPAVKCLVEALPKSEIFTGKFAVRTSTFLPVNVPGIPPRKSVFGFLMALCSSLIHSGLDYGNLDYKLRKFNLRLVFSSALSESISNARI
jgi:hypothetical protein